MNLARASAAMASVVAVAVSSGCAGTIDGAAVRDGNAVPTDVAPLRQSQLDEVMLDLGQLNGIVGTTLLDFVVDGTTMSNNSDAVSDPACLGSIYGAEDLVYAGGGWTAVRHQVARERGDSSRHWIEQAVVLYPAAKQAKDFVGVATSAWQDCSGFSVAVNDGVNSSIWLIGDVLVDDDMVTQAIAQEDSEGWECQHAVTSVSNVSIETLACAFGINDEAITMAQQLVGNAAGQ